MTKEKITSFIITTLFACWGLIAPVHGLILAVGCLIASDFVTGVWKAVKIQDHITSRRFRHTIGKAFIYQMAVISGFALDYLVGSQEPLIAKAFAVAIGLTEAKSIAENFNAITGIDILKVLLEKFKPAPSTTSAPPKDPQ